MNKVLITGGTGFVGGRLAKRLAEENEVYISSRRSLDKDTLRLYGKVIPVEHKSLFDPENFPAVEDNSEAAWQETLASLKRTHEELVETVAAFPDSRLLEQVPGKTEEFYNFFYLFSGIVQHELYHAGQIVMLKKASR